jgi:hypothetical protein
MSAKTTHLGKEHTVSISQANIVACAPITSVSGRPLKDAMVTLRNAAVALAGRVITASQRRQAPDMTRFADHLLGDMGFERDWDGSIVRIKNDPKGWN